MKTISPKGLTFIEKWEELVLYVYDDKVHKRRIEGVLKYPEWDGCAVVGTLTIGYGHTDAAGWPKIVQGMKITKQQADEMLTEDLKSCIDAVNKVNLPLTQCEFDALVSFTFNCGPGNLRCLLKGLTHEDYKTRVPARLMQYVHSKGERMQGLVNRRSGEVQLWGTLDEEGAEDHLAIPSNAERAPTPKPMLHSKTGWASILTGAFGTGISLNDINNASGQLATTKSNFEALGVFNLLAKASGQPLFWVGVAIVVVGAFIYWDRSKRLEEEHV